MRQSVSSAGRQWLTIAAVLLAITINALSNFYPPAGKNIGEVSNTTFADVLITPAGYAFAIWGVIYVGLIAFSIYQALPDQRHQRAIARTAWAIVGACLLQIAWVYAFLVSYFWLSVGLMAGILVCLILAYLPTRVLRPTRSNRWLVQAPISVYFGWITVAAVVNVSSALLISLPPAWATASTGSVGLTIVMLVISGVIAATIALRYSDAAYPAVTVWALIAIALRHLNILPLAITAAVLAVALSGIIIKIIGTGRAREQPSDQRL